MNYFYSHILKPIFFRLNPEFVHERMTALGIFLGRWKITRTIIRTFFRYNHPVLEQDLFGLHFKNPVGLSAGFDYNIQLARIIESVGFSFMSGGTVTFSPYKGNPKPRLARLPKSRSLLVNKGFKSLGVEKVLEQLVFSEEKDFHLGISIGATNSPFVCDPEGQVEDIPKSFRFLMNHPKGKRFSYYELNISCPNVAGSGVLAEPEILDRLLRGIREIIGDRVLFVKFQAEIEWREARELVAIMVRHRVNAITVANLVKKRDNPTFEREEIENINERGWKGNFSGKPVEQFSNELISNIYREFGDQIKIIGVGGIFSAEDAYEKIKRGASLVQLITGMIFKGPQLIGNINKELVELLEADGYEQVTDAIGVYHRE